MKFSHERKVRSLAKKTFGSTRVGRAILLPVKNCVSIGTSSSCRFKLSYLERFVEEVVKTWLLMNKLNPL